jgi:NAD(P)-dependent dehydrogenase (short-subunit alcohol dehydrogenase family)
MNRPETIEETAALVDEAGGRGIAVQVDHLVPDEVRALVDRIRGEQGRLHILVNDIWGATRMEWNKSVWESSLDSEPFHEPLLFNDLEGETVPLSPTSPESGTLLFAEPSAVSFSIALFASVFCCADRV